jgi:hypothetical protein
MGLRSSKPKRSKDHTIKNSVKNKHGQQANKFREQTSDNRHSAKKTGKQNSDIGFQIKKNKNKGKICQMKESAQVTEESDTDSEDSTKIKSERTEAPIPTRIPIAGSSPSRSKKTRDDFDIDKWDDEESHQTSSLSPPLDELETCLDEYIEETGRRSSFTNIFMPLCMRSSPTRYKCHSSENNETQITRMDKIIAELMIPHVPRRNRPATPPRDVLD